MPDVELPIKLGVGQRGANIEQPPGGPGVVSQEAIQHIHIRPIAFVWQFPNAG